MLLPLLLLLLLVSSEAAAEGFRPLQTFWSAAREDNTAVATADGAASALAAQYVAAAPDGAVMDAASAAPPGAVPLQTYFSAAFNDSMQVAGAQGRAYAAANNYTWVRQEGWVLPAAPATGSGVRLLQFYHSGRRDHYLVASGTQVFLFKKKSVKR